MKLLIKSFLFFFLISRMHSAELIFTCHGVDRFPVFDQIDDQNTFMTYTNEHQCTSNTSMITFGTANGVVETLNGKQLENIVSKNTDRFGNIGYMRSVPADMKHYRENNENITGSSINSWEFIGGTGPFADLKGIIMTGAYLQLGQNRNGSYNFIWKAKATGVPDKIIEKINNYKKKEE